MKNLFRKVFAPQDGIRRQVAELQAELAELKASQSRGPIDLVRLDGVSLFMPVQDNLYRVVIPEQSKNFSLDKHYELAQSDKAPTDDELDVDVTKPMLLYLDALFSRNLSVHLLDIGAWVGDVAIRLGKFAKIRGGKFRAECFDPSYAGEFIPFNIELNGVSDYVVFRPVGISLSGGPQVFSQFRGHSDSSRLQSIENSGQLVDYYLVRTKALPECLPQKEQGAHLIIKIDVEGIDAQLVRQNHELLTEDTLIVEFAPGQDQYREFGTADFIRLLQKTHTLFDIFYLPRPTMARHVDNPDQFVQAVSARQYGYTDVLGIPHSLPAHGDLVARVMGLPSIEPEYRMA